VTEERLVERFLRESTAVQAHTVRVSRDEVVACLLGLLEGDQSVVAAAGLDGIVEELRSRGVQIASDDGSGGVAQALPGADAGLCRALGAVAVSGTVLVGPGSGFEGLISILPPHCVILLYGGACRGGPADHGGLSSGFRHRAVPHLRHRTHLCDRSARTSAAGCGGHR
jgi:L-lactate utilization protein LutC